MATQRSQEEREVAEVADFLGFFFETLIGYTNYTRMLFFHVQQQLYNYTA